MAGEQNIILNQPSKASKFKKYHTAFAKLSHLILNLNEAQQVKLLQKAEELFSKENRVYPRKSCKIPIRFSTYDRIYSGYDEVVEGDYVVLTITDPGVGIAAEEINRIFEPFYTKKVMGRSGTGLGMAVVWGTVKDHKGYIHVESELEKGTTFKLYFPITRKDIPRKQEPKELADYSGNGESILVVDDVKEQREVASQILSQLGYSVRLASSGEEAVNFIRNETADLIVLDMIMSPGIDGLETYERIISMHPNQKAIIASGFSETNRVKKTQQLGAGTYVRKPYTIEKIGIAVKAELKKEKIAA